MENSETSTGSRPKLWNPLAAFRWSLFFSPILGAWLHSRNWKELNEPDRAKKSMIWVYIGVVILLLVPFLPDKVGASPGLLFLAGWYFFSARHQIKHIKENDIDYEKKSWSKPLLLGVAGLVVYFGLVVGGFILSDPSLQAMLETESEPPVQAMLETESVPPVKEILEEKAVSLFKDEVYRLGGSLTCESVSIENEDPDGYYNAVAHMDNGDDFKFGLMLQDGVLFIAEFQYGE